MRRPIAAFIINLEQRELFTYFLLLLKVLLSSPWGKNLFFEIFQNLGCKAGAIPKLTPKRENYNFDKKNAKIDGYGNLVGCYCIKW